MTTTTISGAGAHASVASTDRIPASKGGVKGYHTVQSIRAGDVPYGTTTTINVPADYSTIAAAFAAIENWGINGTLIIQVADGTYVLTSPLILEHPFGQNIRIIGNTTTPANCVIRVSTAINAIYVGDGCAIDLIDGFKIEHDTPATRYATAGVLCDRGAAVRFGANVDISGFYWGFYARYNGYIEANSTTADSCGDAGYIAYMGGMISTDGAASTNNNDSSNNLGSGFVAEGGTIFGRNATASGNWFNGFTALHNGYMSVQGSSSTSNTHSGYYADEGGSIALGSGSDASGNTEYGKVIADQASSINGTLTNTGAANTLGTTSGPRVIGSSQTSGTSAGYFENTADSAVVELFRMEGNRAAPASSDQGYYNIWLSDTSGNQKEAARISALVADGAAASFRTQLLISLYTGNALTFSYRLSASAFSCGANDQQTMGSSTVGWADYYGATGHRFYFNNSVFWTSGSGTPEGSVTAPVGSFYTRSDGGANTTLYIKESGVGNTGWIAK